MKLCTLVKQDRVCSLIKTGCADRFAMFEITLPLGWDGQGEGHCHCGFPFTTNFYNKQAQAGTKQG